jgi:hypothetical protein
MSNYKEKYLKYKSKYLSLKNKVILRGGTIEIADIDPDIVAQKLIEKKSNLGQRNCGIVFIDNYAIKCLSKSSTPDYNAEYENKYAIKAELIERELEGFYPKLYRWRDGRFINFIKIINPDNGEIKYAKCIIMEKLDGDLTDYLLKNSYLRTFGNFDNYDFFYNRLPKTVGFYIDEYVLEDDTEEVKQKKIENTRKFDEIKDPITPVIYETINILNEQIIMLHYYLLRNGWKYGDLKLDNLGYKLQDDKIKLYFIDEESGLRRIIEEPKPYWFSEPDYKTYLESRGLKTNLGNYGILGQYELKHIFDISFDDYEPVFENKQEILDLLSSKDFQILEQDKDYYGKDLGWIKIKKNGTDNFFVIQPLLGRYRLVFFDNEGKHKSNPTFNHDYPPIDELYDSLEGVYKKLSEVYRVELLPE